ncbi:MAG: aryl-sulfate sulfotransferase, partial [Bacteroidales bacterium]|nr:aryl-sulfate sulfotransferase [Bacteroidales bacterium]
MIYKSFLLLLLGSWYNLSIAQSWGDYTLYSVRNTNVAYLIDLNNNVYKTWTFSSAYKTGYSSYLLPGSNLLRTVYDTPNSFTGGGQTGRMQKVDWNGNMLWDFLYCTTAYSMHHDICPMPNGNVLLISYELRTAAEVTQAGGTYNNFMWSEKIVEVKQTGPTTGEIVWEWKVWDHLVQNVDPSKDNYKPSITNNPQLININYRPAKDWIHMNGVDYNPILNQIVVSSHNFNELWVIDHSTTTAEAASHSGGNTGKGGDLLYRWGNPAAYNASGTNVFRVVHDSHWIPEGSPNAGRLAAFNNQGVSTTRSSVDQIIPPRIEYLYNISLGSAFAPSTYTQRHTCNGYSSNESGSQSLPNGNLLVCMAMSGLMYEVNPAGTTVWSKQASGVVSKAYRYSACYITNPTPPIPVITLSGTSLVSSTGATYQWYRNGDLIPDATAQTYTPTQNGIYVVRITDVNNCHFSYSAGKTFSGNNSVPATPYLEKLSIYPNPTQGILTFSIPASDIIKAEIFDLQGKILAVYEGASTIDFSVFV